MKRSSLNRLRIGVHAVALTLTLGQALAIDGGAVAGRNRLSRAAVAVGTLVAGDDAVSLTRCTGVLIAPDRVLTAAHCVRGNPLAAVVVPYNGSRSASRPVRVVSIAGYDADMIDLPSRFSGLGRLSLDTAVLRLAAPIPGREPLQIAHGRRPPAELRLAGAGLSGEGVGTLKTTRLHPLLVTSTGLVIAETEGSAVCRGDSGGPVVADGPHGPILWGVASAVLTSQPSCGRVVVIAPASPAL